MYNLTNILKLFRPEVIMDRRDILKAAAFGAASLVTGSAFAQSDRFDRPSGQRRQYSPYQGQDTRLDVGLPETQVPSLLLIPGRGSSETVGISTQYLVMVRYNGPPENAASVTLDTSGNFEIYGVRPNGQKGWFQFNNNELGQLRKNPENYQPLHNPQIIPEMLRATMLDSSARDAISRNARDKLERARDARRAYEERKGFNPLMALDPVPNFMIIGVPDAPSRGQCQGVDERGRQVMKPCP